MWEWKNAPPAPGSGIHIASYLRVHNAGTRHSYGRVPLQGEGEKWGPSLVPSILSLEQ